MKFSPKCRTKKLGMIYTILVSLCSFWNWERADIRPQIRPRKIPAGRLQSITRSQAPLDSSTYMINYFRFSVFLKVPHISLDYFSRLYK